NPAGTSGSMEFRTNLYFCCACAETALKPSSARKTPARIKNKPIKQRGLRNPLSSKGRRTGVDAEVECFFMVQLHLNRRFLIEPFEQSIVFILCPGRGIC